MNKIPRGATVWECKVIAAHQINNSINLTLFRRGDGFIFDASVGKNIDIQKDNCVMYDPSTQLIEKVQEAWEI